MQVQNINGKQIKFKTSSFEGKKSKEFYENQIFSSLNKIGITSDFIQINYFENLQVEVIWKINKKQYCFKCSSQNSKTKNLGAISQAIQEDIRQITRGIKDIFMIMTQYESKSKIIKKKGLLDFENSDFNKNLKNNFSINSIKSDSKISGILDPKYNYLRKLSDDKLDLYYLKFKEECIKLNQINHPMLKALKIIRQDRGLKL